MNSETNKRVLLVEDELEVRLGIRKFLERYEQDLEILEATNAGEAMDLLFQVLPDERPDALILDLMIPYGTVAQELNADSDPDQIETGVQLLRHLREREKGGNNRHSPCPLWVAVITARNNPSLIQRLRQLLGGRGRIYFKPFNDLELEHDLAHVLGIPSKVHPDDLPPGYMPPSGQVEAGAR